jgi:hypothetical protein
MPTKLESNQIYKLYNVKAPISFLDLSGDDGKSGEFTFSTNCQWRDVAL